MKRFLWLVFLLTFLLQGCSHDPAAQVVTTTLPVYEFTTAICDGTGITVDRLITENISCLHDYTLQVKQTKALEASEVVIISGVGLESFLSDFLPENKPVIDASGIHVKETEAHEEEDHKHGHSHDTDPHIWLSFSHAKEMCNNICTGLIENYPKYESVFRQNLIALLERITELEEYGHTQLAQITCRNIITFHDGFGCLAEDFDIHIIKAIEEESGSEASAKELIQIIELIREYRIGAIFTEKNGSASAAKIISNETGVQTYQLDMAISGESWFEAMRNNINTLKEALE